MGFINDIGLPGLVIIVVAALVIFGPKKLPELGRAIGKMVSEFKGSISDITSFEDKDNPAETVVDSRVETTSGNATSVTPTNTDSVEENNPADNSK